MVAPTTSDQLRTDLWGHPVSAASIQRYFDGWGQRMRWPGSAFPVDSPPQVGTSLNPMAPPWRGPNFAPTSPMFFMLTGGGPQLGFQVVTPPPAPYLVGLNGIEVVDENIHGYVAGDGVSIDGNVVSASGVATKYMLITNFVPIGGADYRWEYEGVECDPTTGAPIEGGETFVVINTGELMNTADVIGYGVSVEGLLDRGFFPLPIGVTQDMVLQDNVVVPLFRPPEGLRGSYEWVMDEPTNVDGACTPVSTSGITISDTEPSSPEENDVWWDTDA